jgi:thioredoxin 2
MMADSTRHVVCPHCSAINRTPPDRPARQAKCGTCHQKLFSGKPASADAETFERHITRNDIPVMVDFWAPWCGPCLAMAPAYERAAAELEPDYRLLKVNTEEEPALAARYGIRAYRPSYCSCTVARSHGVPGRAMRAGSFPGQRRRVSTGGPRPVRIDGRSRRANPDRPLVHTTKRFTSTDELYSAAMRSQVISRCSSLSPARRGGGMRTMRSPSKRTPRT